MEELSEKKKRKYKIIRNVIQVVILALILALIIWASIVLLPYFTKINNDEAFRDEIVETLRSYGGWSWLIIIGGQILQTILVIIPSGPIVMVSGVLFHPAVAILLCIIGQTLGAIIVFYLVKWLGYRFVALFINPDQIKNSKFLKNTKRCEVLMFGYLLIPALPKDIVSFVAPFTNIKIKNFILINVLSRIPMTIVTVYMGDSIFSGEYGISLTLAIISGVLALLCFIFNKKIVQFLENRQSKKTKEDEEI